ncbi:MAG TPA: hypothetical protein VER11_24375 [Polyangiaceae bacterium]|nr:hypothetical protein [Polyangiaceae bacterium]
MKASLLICFCAALVGCSGAADIPDTPDLRELLANYQAPTASLDATSAAQALKSAPALEDLEQLSAGFQAAQSVMDDVDQASSASSASTGSRIRLQGKIGLEIRCPGELGNPTFDEKVNGSISLTLAVADTQIRRSFGGEAKACVLRGTLLGNPAKIVLDGPIAFDVGNNIGIGSRWSGEFLAQLPGTLTVLDHEYRGISGRFTHGRFQYLITLDDGTIVLELSGDGGITILDHDGAWLCHGSEPCAKQ